MPWAKTVTAALRCASNPRNELTRALVLVCVMYPTFNEVQVPRLELPADALEHRSFPTHRTSSGRGAGGEPRAGARYM